MSEFSSFFYKLKNYIHLNFAKECLDLPGEEGDEARSTLVHEYTHYMQAISTVYGIGEIQSLYSTLYKFSMEMPNTVLKAPIQESQISAVKKLLISLQKLHDQKSFSSTASELPKEDRSYTIYDNTVFCKFTSNLGVSTYVPVNNRAIHENMAIAAEKLKSSKKISKKRENQIQYTENVEYGIIFNLFKKYKEKVDNYSIFIYRICDLLLLTENPQASLAKNIEAIVHCLEDVEEKRKVHLVLESLLNNSVFGSIIRYNIEEKIMNLGEQVQEYENMDLEMHYGVVPFLKTAKECLESRLNSNNLEIFPAGQWSQAIPQKIGSPAIIFSTERVESVAKVETGIKEIRRLKSEHPLNEVLDLLLGIPHVLFYSIDNRFSECPFIPICSAEIKEISKGSACTSNPYEVHPDANENDNLCLFRQCAIHLHLAPRPYPVK